MSSIDLKVDAQIFKLRDTSAVHFCRRNILCRYMTPMDFTRLLPRNLLSTGATPLARENPNLKGMLLAYLLHGGGYTKTEKTVPERLDANRRGKEGLESSHDITKARAVVRGGGREGGRLLICC